jgi:catechol 2,3-dioxygenase-like lactoylglutathione lyase family enzyme
MMKKKLTFGLMVKNYDEAIDFYTNKLGFVVAEDIPMGEDRWVTITAPGNNDGIIALHQAISDVDRALIGKQFGTFPYLGIETEDCIGDYNRMKALGVRFKGEPNVQPYGTGVMLEDLYGNHIYMNQDPLT